MENFKYNESMDFSIDKETLEYIKYLNEPFVTECKEKFKRYINKFGG